MVFKWPPLKRGLKITVVIPSSNLEIFPTLKGKTEFVGKIARALAIFRVSRVVVVRDSRDADLFVTLLKYLLLAPYLRRKIVPITNELRYVGVLPPLSIVTHNPEGSPLRRGMLRDGLVEISWGVKGRVFVGDKKRCVAEARETLFPGERVLVRVIKEDPLRCRVENPDEIGEYVGFKVLAASLQGSLSNEIRGYVPVLTSKEGRPFGKGLARKLLGEISSKKTVTLYFGNYSDDFDGLLKKAVIKSRDLFKYKVNFMPGQGTFTIRSDEAVLAVLASLDTSIRLVIGSKT